MEAADQAYTYAVHPEVRAVYFVLYNGSKLAVHTASAGPEVEPILRLRLRLRCEEATAGE